MTCGRRMKIRDDQATDNLSVVFKDQSGATSTNRAGCA